MTNIFIGRINRRNFLIGTLITYLIILLTAWMFGSQNTNDLFSVVGLVLLITESLFYISLFVRRIHDIGWSIWFFLLLFIIPFVNLYAILALYLKGGEAKNNKYGTKPSQNMKFPSDILS
jgi:uncharacterized membrane protein YhaH (DUF805 family)